MAEIKNSFISSKMNKDLDDRLIPNDQYRDALNIEVGKSEANNIGVLQNVYGNERMPLTTNTEFIPGTTTINPNYIPGLECIGFFMDNQNNRIFQFLTDYEDEIPNEITYPPEGKTIRIVVYNLSDPVSYVILVEGLFLNFAKNTQFRITGVNLVEGLLFWTDNRNQPRKINVNLANPNNLTIPTYYTTEEQISVAKYAPIDPITMYKKETATVVSGAGDTWGLSNMSSLACTIDTVSGGPPAPYTAKITTAVTNGFANFSIGDVVGGTNGTGSFGLGQIIITSIVSPTSIQVSSTVIFTAGTVSITLKYPYLGAIQPGATVLSNSSSGVQFLDGSDYATVVSMSNTTLTLYQPTTDINNNYILTFLISTMSDKSSVPTWPGDPAFLEDKYVRFSYRFKYDDNEYSLMAPFTQIAYIPKQKGYFIAGNETDAYRSTILNWFENNINNIELIVPFPDKVGNLNNSYKIQEVDILYKESDSNAIKVFETIPISAINTLDNTNNNYYIQPYQSQKPYKTLPEDQTVRVYDKVPVRAKAQESAGNRIIYGNYFDKYTCLSSINYNMSVQTKSSVGTNFIEYPNHTLKKNRNYQVGFVLADKFGRQSPVILSTVDLTSTNIGGGNFAKGSTVYSGYEDTLLFTDVRSWFGDALILYLNAPIDQARSIPSGTPGLYAIATSNFGFAITASTITDTTYKYTLDTTATLNTPPVNGNIMRGFYTDYVKVLSNPIPTVNPNEYTITTSGRVGDIYKYVSQAGGIKDIKFVYEYNPIGWYSYKIVVKQQEQDYYNVYLPGMLNGYPKSQTSGSQVVYSGIGPTATSTLENGINTTQFPVSETGNTSHIVLINDNINKVPRDLSEVGPDQKQYRSSVQLYGRVENTEANIIIKGNSPTWPAYSAKVRTIEYSIDPLVTPGQGDYSLIKPGDGIQCVEANTPAPNTVSGTTTGGTMPNLYRWLGDTVVVSNVIVGTIGTITISSPNWVLQAAQNPIPSPQPGSGDYRTFIITRAENRQYFPTRKADTVISIASADEFNFLDSSEDNLSGTAGLNFYQLQTKPLIGRVSTVNKMGVIAADMIPFLGVYETRPEQSLLELFWETATTGLISDLNADVLTGFEGPSSFGELVYRQFENQNPLGTDLGPNNYGDPNSKYITSEFYVLDQNVFPLANTSVTLLSVTDNTGPPALDRTAEFGLETIIGPVNKFKLKILSRFVFNNNAATAENYTFVFNVQDNTDPSTATQLTITGRLGNIAPEIRTTETLYNITQDTTSIVTLDAVNGAYFDPLGPPPVPPTGVKTGLKWTIVSGDTTSSFLLSEYTGELSLINPNVPIGIYNLVIKVQDAVNTGTGAILPVEGTDFGTKFNEKTFTINVGDDPVPFWLRPNYASNIVTNPIPCSGPTNATPVYGVAYIGPNAGANSSYVPVVPGCVVENNQFVENVEVKNAAASGVSPIVPLGLEKGEYRFSIELQVGAPSICSGLSFATIRAEGEIYLYKRIYTLGGINPWVLSANENNYGITPPIYRIGPLVVSTIDDGSGPIFGQPQELTTSFTVEVDESISPAIYEYAVGVKLIQERSNADMANPWLRIYGNDANYSYDQTLPFTPPRPPITTAYSFYTGVAEYNINPLIPGETSAVPYTTQDAIRGTNFISLTNGVNSGIILPLDESVKLILTTANEQIVPGLFYTFTSSTVSTFTGYVTGINVDNNPSKIALQLLSPYSGSVPGDLVDGNIKVETVVQTDPPSIGVLYANTEEGTEIKRLYTDSAFTQKWIPPVADRFYNFQTSKDYNPNNVTFVAGPLKYSKYPYYCAKFSIVGEVIDQIVPYPNVQTSWEGQKPANSGLIVPVENYSYNMYYVSNNP
jgi:hypothetical protein